MCNGWRRSVRDRPLPTSDVRTLHRQVSAGVEGHRVRRCAGGGQLPHLRVHVGSVEPRPGTQVSDRVDQRRSLPMKAGELKASEPPPACFCTVGPRPAGHPQHPQHNEKLAGPPEVLSFWLCLVPGDCGVQLRGARSITGIRGDIYGSRALESRGDGGSTTFLRCSHVASNK